MFLWEGGCRCVGVYPAVCVPWETRRCPCSPGAAGPRPSRWSGLLLWPRRLEGRQPRILAARRDCLPRAKMEKKKDEEKKEPLGSANSRTCCWGPSHLSRPLPTLPGFCFSAFGCGEQRPDGIANDEVNHVCRRLPVDPARPTPPRPAPAVRGLPPRALRNPRVPRARLAANSLAQR